MENDKDKKVGAVPDTGVQEVQETAGNNVTTQATEKQSEDNKEELQIPSEQGSGESQDDKGNTKLDSKSKEKAATKAGGKTGDPAIIPQNQEAVNKGGSEGKEAAIEPTPDDKEEAGQGADGKELDIETEETYKEAKKVITGMVDEALESVLDEPKETTEKRNRIAKDVFDKNAQCNVLYFTADLIPFFGKSDAFRHGAGTLKNDTIVTVNRK